MVRTSLAVVTVLVVFLSSGTAQEKAKLPKGQGPHFFTVTVVGKDHIELTKVGPMKKGLTVFSTYKPAIKNIEILDPKGKNLSDDEFRTRVKVGTVVLVAMDENRVDPAYLSVLKDDAVVLLGVVVRVESVPPELKK